GGHIVNIASMSSFIPGGASGIYTTSKFAVRGLSECLRYALAPHRIGVSLVCPGLTKTRIFEAPLARPERLANTAFPVSRESLQRLEAIHATGMDPDQVAQRTLAGVVENAFYIFPHSEFKDEVRADCEEILRAFTDEAADPRRMTIEAARRRARQSAQQAVEELRKAL
ncbi:MAG: SDR family NAD(P)-dependent oxidoreductase, partial [Steroidobacteraceae bacterium]